MTSNFRKRFAKIFTYYPPTKFCHWQLKLNSRYCRIWINFLSIGSYIGKI